MYIRLNTSLAATNIHYEVSLITQEWVHRALFMRDTVSQMFRNHHWLVVGTGIVMDVVFIQCGWFYIQVSEVVDLLRILEYVVLCFLEKPT